MSALSFEASSQRLISEVCSQLVMSEFSGQLLKSEIPSHSGQSVRSEVTCAGVFNQSLKSLARNHPSDSEVS